MASPSTLRHQSRIEFAAGAGGGTVRFRRATYLCYSIRLKSNVDLTWSQNRHYSPPDPSASGWRV